MSVLNNQEVLDEDVVKSFIHQLHPSTGNFTKYLKSGNLALLINDILFIHGGINSFNKLFVPPIRSSNLSSSSSSRSSRINREASISQSRNELKQFVDELNGFLHIEVWLFFFLFFFFFFFSLIFFNYFK